MTDLELNEAVARKLKGWCSNCKCTYPVESAHHNCPGEFGNCHHADNCNLPAYRTSIEAAWEIVESLTKADCDVTLRHSVGSKGWYCEIFSWKGYPDPSKRQDEVEHESDTAPRAICEAFLKLP